VLVFDLGRAHAELVRRKKSSSSSLASMMSPLTTFFRGLSLAWAERRRVEERRDREEGVRVRFVGVRS
jgi:hypothetical protein